MDTAIELLEGARRAYAAQDWVGARDGFNAARTTGALGPDDLSALGDAEWWLGNVDPSNAAFQEAHHLFVREGNARAAAMTALGIAVNLFLRGDEAKGAGWMSRAQRLLSTEPEGPEHGYARYMLEVEGDLGADTASAIEAAQGVRQIGERHSDPNLVALGLLGEGRALLRAERTAEGMARLDEVMVAVLSDELTPDWAGNIYCNLMSACAELGDIRRAVEWVEATTRWLELLPAAVLYSGICRVHRAQVLQIMGSWEQAESEARRVCEELQHISVAVVAEGYYQIGELRRLRGDTEGAEAAYHQAHSLGRDPQPGLALLRVAAGQIDSAATSIHSALLADPHNRLARFPLLAAEVEIALAASDLAMARRACAELEETAAIYKSDGFAVAVLKARGALTLEEGRAEEALPMLRAACRRWRELDAPYEAAKVCVLLSRAYLRLEDIEAATLEAQAARREFERLGAVPDLTALDRIFQPRLPAGLTEREAEVLVLVASGRTNREVASTLVLSEKTVARHLSNIFGKIGVTSRSAATAYAFEHGLKPEPRG